MCCVWIKKNWKLFTDNIKQWLIKIGNCPLCRVAGIRDYYGGKIHVPYYMSKKESEEAIAKCHDDLKEMDKKKTCGGGERSKTDSLTSEELK
jgi:hypothetical protein